MTGGNAFFVKGLGLNIAAKNSVFLQLPHLEEKNSFRRGDERRFWFFISWDLKIAPAEQAVRLSCSLLSGFLFLFFLWLTLLPI